MRLALLEQLGDPVAPSRRVEVARDQVLVVRGLDVVVGGREPAPVGVALEGKLVVGDPSDPLMRAVPAGDRARAVAGHADRMATGALVRDRAVDVGVDEVLARAGDLQGGRAEAVDILCVGDREREARAERGVVAGPAKGVRALDRAVAGLERPGDAVREDRSVPRLANGDDAGRRLAAHGDRLLVDRERLPVVAEQRGGAFLVEPLLVEVLHVAGHVGDAPRVVWRRPEEDAGA